MNEPLRKGFKGSGVLAVMTMGMHVAIGQLVTRWVAAAPRDIRLRTVTAFNQTVGHHFICKLSQTFEKVHKE